MKQISFPGNMLDLSANIMDMEMVILEQSTIIPDKPGKAMDKSGTTPGMSVTGKRQNFHIKKGCHLLKNDILLDTI